MSYCPRNNQKGELAATYKRHDYREGATVCRKCGHPKPVKEKQ